MFLVWNHQRKWFIYIYRKIFNAVKNAIKPFGAFKTILLVVADGTKAMKQNIGFVGLLRKSNVNIPDIHCIIHQEALCGKMRKLDGVWHF